MTKEAMKLAIEALNTPRPSDSFPPLWRTYENTINTAIKALEEALKQEQDEPDDLTIAYMAGLYNGKKQAKQEQGELETLNYTVSVQCKRCGSHEKYDLKVDYPLPQQRKPLKNDEFLELLLRKGSREIVAYTTFIGGSIQMQGKIGLLKSAKVIKEFIEECYGIKD